MQNSVIMRRVVLLLVFTILLSAALTTLFYSLTSNVVFARIASSEFRQKADYLAKKSAAYLSDGLSINDFNTLAGSAPELLDATVAIYFYYSPNNIYIASPSNHKLTDDEVAEINKMVRESKAGNSDESISKQVLLGPEKTNTLLVSYPIVTYDRSSGSNTTSGTVFIMRSFEQIKASHSSLNFALIFASCVAFLLMMAPTILGVSAMLKPLRSVRNVALAMAGGNFSLRADSSQQGEFGELAVAVNDLAAALDRSMTALMVERNRLQQILDGLSEGILAVDANLQITHLNPAVKSLFQSLTPVNSGGKRVTESVTPTTEENQSGENLVSLSEATLFKVVNYDLAEFYRNAMQEKRSASHSFVVGERTILLQISPLLDNKSSLIGAVGLFRDITAAEKLEQTRRDYIANVSHELRTPLTALRGLIEPLSDGLVTEQEDRLRYYGIILDETLRLSRLIDDMLELSRLQAGTLSLKMSVFDLAEVLDNLRNKYNVIARHAGITLHFPSDSNITPVYGNADRIEQILVILIDNAFKFTPRGGEIQIFLLDARDKLEISVQDSGKGIDPEDIQHIFERFYKAEKSRGKSGTGLGLSIAKEIMKAMGEDIWAVSRTGQGARFTFTLSKAEQASEEPD